MGKHGKGLLAAMVAAGFTAAPAHAQVSYKDMADALHAVMESDRTRRLRHSCADCSLGRRIGRRGSDVEGLFEERAVERVRLVEDCEHLQVAVRHQALDGELAALDEPLDQCPSMFRVPLSLDVRSPEHAAKAMDGGLERLLIVCTHDAAAPRKRHRLENAWKGDWQLESFGISRQVEVHEPWNGQPGVAKTLARQSFM